MKYINSYSLLLLLVVLSVFTACTPELWDKGIKLSDDTETSQMYYADETYGQYIYFTTSDSWYAEVKETIGSSSADAPVHADWLKLSHYEGQEAGEYAVSITLKVNTTGQPRAAEIIFHCGDSKAVVSVEQRAVTIDGEVPSDDVDDPSLPTTDGKAPYVTFDSDALLLPYLSQSGYELVCHTNIISPSVRIEPASDGNEMACFLYAFNQSESEAVLTMDVYGNPGDAPRTAELVFLDNDGNTFETFELRQEAYTPQVELVQVISEVGSLSFVLQAKEPVVGVYYRLEEAPKPSDGTLEGEYYDLRSQGGEPFELSFDGLSPATTYYLYVTAALEHSMDKELELTGTTAALESKYDLVFEVSANPANNYTVYLPTGSVGQLQGTVDWGDGQTDKYESNPFSGVKHVYDVTEPTTFEVRFSGILTDLSFTQTGGVPARENTLLGIKQWGYTGLEQIDLSDAGCLTYLAPDTERAFRNVQHFGVEPYGGSFTNTGIERIPEGFFDAATQATSFDYTFGGCTQLKELPAGLFRNAGKAESFQRTFIGCVQLQTIPADLFENCREASDFNTTFAGCTALEEIPAGLFAHTVKAYNFEATFSGCSSLRSIPADLFANCPDARYFGQCTLRTTDPRGGGLGCFQNCTSLTSIPEGLFANNKNVQDFSYTFNGCRQLTDVPASLFASCTDAAYMEGTFQYCSALQQVPAELFDQNRRVVHMGKLFYSCGLQCESPYTLVEGAKVHLYEREQYNLHFVAPSNHYQCFRNCQDMTDYESVPDNWK